MKSIASAILILLLVFIFAVLVGSISLSGCCPAGKVMTQDPKAVVVFCNFCFPDQTDAGVK